MIKSFLLILTGFELSSYISSETVMVDDAPSAEGFYGYSNNLDLAEFNASNNENLYETTTTPEPSTTQAPSPITHTQEISAQAPPRTDRAISLGNIGSILMDLKNAIIPARDPYSQVLSPETTNGLDILIEKYSPKMSMAQIRAIYLGTKWCGDGNISPDGKHVGYFYFTDSCCKQHDLCPDSISANQSKHGLTNSGKFTRSHCDCDSKFYSCLKTTDTIVSKQIGFIYFDVLGPECFREEYAIEKCRHRVRNRCETYVLDKNSTSKTYQWFDNKFF